MAVAVGERRTRATGEGLLVRGARPPGDAQGQSQPRPRLWSARPRSWPAPAPSCARLHHRSSAGRTSLRAAAARVSSAPSVEYPCHARPSSSASPASARAACSRSSLASSNDLPRARDLAAGPLPALRRRCHLLGPLAEIVRGSGRHPRDAMASLAAEATPRGESCPSTRDAHWLRAAAAAPPRPRGGGGSAARRTSPPGGEFLESLAAYGPAVIVVEDLHWADEALLAFLE